MGERLERLASGMTYEESHLLQLPFLSMLDLGFSLLFSADVFLFLDITINKKIVMTRDLYNIVAVTF